MTPKELTPVEALRVWRAVNPGAPMIASLYVTDFANALLAKFGGCSPEEKRDAERAVWDDAAEFFREHPSSWGAAGSLSKSERDSRYPSVKPKPPTVTLSDGTQYRREDRHWLMATTKAAVQWQTVSVPSCVSGDDFAKCESVMKAEESR